MYRYNPDVTEPGFHHVEDQIMYWAAKGPCDLEFVPKFKGLGSDPPIDADPEMLVHYKIWNFQEDVFDEVRIKTNPEAPSRIGCIFLCPKLDSGFCSKPSEWSARTHVYEVLFSGTIFTTDSEMWTEARQDCMRALGGNMYGGAPSRWLNTAARERAKDEISSWARSYWQGNTSYGMEESICDGVAILGDLIYVKEDK
jgi:hypothetical protein